METCVWVCVVVILLGVTLGRRLENVAPASVPQCKVYNGAWYVRGKPCVVIKDEFEEYNLYIFDEASRDALFRKLRLDVQDGWITAEAAVQAAGVAGRAVRALQTKEAAQ